MFSTKLKTTLPFSIWFIKQFSQRKNILLINSLLNFIYSYFAQIAIPFLNKRETNKKISIIEKIIKTNNYD